MDSGVTFRQIVTEAMHTYEDEVGGKEALAVRIIAGLRKHGLAIHAESSCIRLPGPIGREMTPEELATLPMGGNPRAHFNR